MKIKQFNGLNNTSDPLRLGLQWLATADNLDISDTGALSKRKGYTLDTAGVFTSAFSTFDFGRMYVVVNGELRTKTGVVLLTGLSQATMFWTEVNDQVFFNNGTDAGIILPDNTVLPWRWTLPNVPAVAAVTGALPAGTYQVRCTGVLPDGRETGTTDPAEITLTEGQALQISGLTVGCNVYITPADSDVYQLAGRATNTAFVWNTSPDNLGRDLLNAFLDPLPTETTAIAHWKGRMYAAQYMPTEDQTVLWFSEPMAYHLFNYNSNFILLPGKVLMLTATDEALIVGTDKRVYAYNGQQLTKLAAYGVVAGQHAFKDTDGKTYFWSMRGVCSALPFSNLTEKQVSVAPGLWAGGCIVRAGGQRRYLAVLQQGGVPFNAF